MARSSNTLNIKYLFLMTNKPLNPLYRMGENDQLVVKQEKFLKPNGELCVRRYVQSRLLGKGGFGKVYQFNCLETNELYAAKIIPKASLKDEMHMQKVLNIWVMGENNKFLFSSKLKSSCIRCWNILISSNLKGTLKMKKITIFSSSFVPMM